MEMEHMLINSAVSSVTAYSYYYVRSGPSPGSGGRVRML